MRGTRNSHLGGLRSASVDINHRPHNSHIFWTSMLTIQRNNHWNDKFHTELSAERKPSDTRSLNNSVNNGRRFGGSTTSSVGRGQEYGVWGKKTEHYQNRDASPAFGGARVRAIREDQELCSQKDGFAKSTASDARQNLKQKSTARFTYSQIQIGKDEGELSNTF